MLPGLSFFYYFMLQKQIIGILVVVDMRVSLGLFYSHHLEGRGGSMLSKARPLAVGLVLIVLSGNSFGQAGNGWSPSVAVYPGADLNFGRAAGDQGDVLVIKSSSSGGSFEIKAQLRGNQRIMVQITTAEGEKMVDYGGTSVPYKLRVAYNESANSRSGATEITGTTVELDPRANQVKSGPGPPHRSAFVYVYGTANVGNVGSGTYTDDITLHAEIVGERGDNDDFDDDYDDEEEDKGDDAGDDDDDDDDTDDG